MALAMAKKLRGIVLIIVPPYKIINNK